MAARKVSRKRLLKEPDEFLTFSARMIEFFQQNKKAVIGAVVAGFVVLALGVGLRAYFKQQSAAAFDLLSKVEKAYADTVVKQGPQAALEAVEKDLRHLVEDYGSRIAGRLGAYLYGAFLLEAGQADGAIENYQRALKYLEQYPGFKQIILSGLGHAYENKKQWEKALAFYQKVLDAETDLMDDMALFQMGRLYEYAGKIAESRQAFKRLEEQYPQSLYAGPAREKANG